jgi:F0F1-type ATP synthase membrane subunit c/vacuolar-type H+-ATPase subunit K
MGKYFKSLILIYMLFIGSVVFAQNTNISLTLIVQNVPSGPANGLIVVESGGNYQVSTTRSDTKTVGVITENPAITLRKSNNPQSYFVNSSGISLVKASNKSGKITKGDGLTSSDLPGTAVKAEPGEFIVGIALEDFDAPEGLVRADIRTGYSQNSESFNRSLLSIFRTGTQSLYLSPINSLRYVLAAIIGIASFLFGFSIFSKISGSGIQALGRNPLARKTIEFNIIIEFILNIAIIVFGLVIAYFILAL